MNRLRHSYYRRNSRRFAYEAGRHRLVLGWVSDAGDSGRVDRTRLQGTDQPADADATGSGGTEPEGDADDCPLVEEI